jgi:hypothetical protein
MVQRFPGDALAAQVPDGGLLLLARGIVEVRWSRPFGDPGWAWQILLATS